MPSFNVFIISVENFLIKRGVLKWGRVDNFISLQIRKTVVSYMMQFLGNIDAKIDTKARVFVPAGFRRILQAENQSVLVLRKDIFQDCLVLYPEKVWEEEVSTLRSRLSRWDKKEQQLFRQFVLGAERLEIDASGRILIPKKYMQMVGISSEVSFVGVDNTIELWAKGKIDEALLPIDSFSEEIERLMNDE